MFDLVSLAAMFTPRSIAVIGASAHAERIGGRVIANSLAAGFTGQVYPVNPGRTEIQGLQCYASIDAIGAPVDLAIIAVPASGVADALRQAADCGAKAAIVFSSGFAELGGDAAEAQDALVEICRAAGMRLLGPNCMGLMNASTGLVASFGRLHTVASPFGGISVVAQSGAFAAHCAYVMRRRGMRLDLWAATGNQADITLADCVAAMAHAPNTSVIVACIEGFQDAARLTDALAIARGRKIPVVLMKIGRSEVGHEAAASHTAALAGSDAVFDAVIRQYDAYRADSIDELMDVAYACAAGKFSRHPSIGLITTSGGFGVMMADAAAACGLSVPPLPPAAQAELRGLVPFAGVRNPIDVTGQYLNDEGIIRPMFETLLRAGNHEAAIFYVGSPSTLERLLLQFEAVAAANPTRLLAVIVVTDENIRRRFEASGYLVYEDPVRAVIALAAVHRFGAAHFRNVAVAAEDVLQAIQPPGGAVLTERHAKHLLAAAGIPVVTDVVATSAEAAGDAAVAIGFPVAMKILSADIAHKSDVGGVVLGVANRGEAAAAYRAIMANVGHAAPQARLDGVIVAPFLRGGVEVILGGRQDPHFGAVILLGLGGIFVEALDATSLRAAPISLEVAHQMIAKLKGAVILHAARGRPPADVDGLAAALVALSRFVAANVGWLDSVEINPLLVLPKGSGVVAVDALITPRADRS